MKKTSSGFTLVELLIVIAIIGILAGLVSSAIVKITGTAAKKRIENNAERLRAAIQEYWHDMGRWPVPDDAKPVLVKAGKKKKDVRDTSTADSAYETTYNYVMTFKGDGTKGDLGPNSVIVGRLLDALLPDKTTRKTFLDLHNFQVPAEENVSKWPVSETIDAWVAWKDEKRDAPLLVYQSKFVVCPHCKRYYFASGAEVCNYDGSGDGLPDCSYYQENDHRMYRFTEADRQAVVSAALPYVLKFDLNNNIVDVRAEPGDFQFQK